MACLLTGWLAVWLAGWMNSAEQGEWVRNHSKYADYTNGWLNELGSNQSIEFEKSQMIEELEDTKTKLEDYSQKLEETIEEYCPEQSPTD